MDSKLTAMDVSKARWPYFVAFVPCWLVSIPFVVLLGYPFLAWRGLDDFASAGLTLALWTGLGAVAAAAFWRRRFRLGLGVMFVGLP